MVRTYVSDCSSPGTARHSYVYSDTASSSIPAHCRNHDANPALRDKLCAAAFSTRPAVGPSAASERVTRSLGGKRLPCSILAT